MRAVAYCRVSTNKDEQLDSLESQQKFFYEYAVKNSYELVHIYADEGKSGTKIKNRTELLKLLSDAGKGNFEVVLIKDISRLARNTVDFLTSLRQLKRLNIRVIFVNYDQTSSDSSEFMLTMLSAIAQEESANTSKRVKFGKKQNARLGRVPNLVYGYDKTPGKYFDLTVNEKEASVVRRIFDLYTQGNIGTNRIAAILNKEGIRTKRGCTWSQNAVSRVLTNDIYRGRIINGKEEVEDFLTGKRKAKEEENWYIVNRDGLRLVEEECFKKAQLLLKSRKDSFALTGKKNSQKNTFSTMIKCLVCGSTFRRLKRSYANTYISWVCNGRNSKGATYCSNKISIDEECLFQSVYEYFLNLLAERSAYTRSILKEYMNREKEISSLIDEKDRIRKRNKLEEDKQKYITMFLNNIISLEELKTKTDSIRDSIYKLEETPEKKRNSFVTTAARKVEGEAALEKILKKVISSNALLKQLICRIEVGAEGEIHIYLPVYASSTDPE